jgi:predicted ATPase
LQALALHDPDTFSEIQDRLGRAIGFPEAVETAYRPSIAGGPGRANLVFRETAFPDVVIPPESVSDGTIRLLTHLAALLADPSASLICIEEPNHGLHPHLMLRLADAVRSVVDIVADDDGEYRRPQVIFTTHNPDFLDCFDLEVEANYLRVFVAERDLDSGRTAFRTVEGKELAHWLDEYRLGELVRMGVIR